MAEDTSVGPVEPFTYQPLLNPEKEIRLLWLRPADDPFDLITCSLHVVALKDVQAYVVQVIDSAEEDPLLDHAILCNEVLLQMASRFYGELLKLRRNGWQWVWMKQICVDQGNAEECVRQESKLTEIYQRALRCFVWLPAFHYEPISRDGQIRLLELLPGDSEETTMRAILRTVALEDCPAYEILNMQLPQLEGYLPEYKTLTCNGQSLIIDSRIYKVLEYLLSSGNSILWIRAICLDGNEANEADYHARLWNRIERQTVQTINLSLPACQYQHLETNFSEIRLLRVRPARSADAPLHIEVFTASLDDKPDYHALSYYWGPNDRIFGIICTDGTILRVTKHLFLSLRELRQYSYHVLWADQVCINQNDNEEKSQQVTMMRRIHQQATSVIVELGGFRSDLQHHKHYHDWRTLMRILSLTRKTLLAVRPGHPEVDQAEFPKYGIPPMTHRSWKLWQAVRALPWFSRSWVIQEVTACDKIWALCNNQLFRWNDLADANNAYRNEPIDLNAWVVHQGRRTLHNTDHVVHSNETGNHSLLDLLSTFRSLQTTDPRDKIYAFLGMAADISRAPEPNYSQSVEEIYQSFARYFIAQGQGMEVISEAGSSRKSLNIPSWAPDWSYNSDHYRFNHAKGSIWTCLNSQPRFPGAEVNLTDDPSTISVRGAVVDVIIGVTPGVQWTKQNVFNYGISEEHFLELDAAAHELLQTRGEVGNRYGDKIWDTYARTLIGNNTSSFADPRFEYDRAKAEAPRFPKNKSDINENPLINPQNKAWYRSRDAHVEERRFCVTRTGDMGLVPTPAEVGDIICRFKGCKAPFVLKESGRDDVYILVGDAYIHGLMQDHDVDRNDLEMTRILLK